uniref:Uncharacterized protein n=1 Tax=Fusarium oxysporum (strain Fo5176) TaxID=660025 RepID=A0A0D2Y929_FUSOF
MSLLRRTAHSISPHARPSLSAINTTRRISHPAILSSLTSSPYANRRNFSVASALGETVTVTADALSWAHSAGVPCVCGPLLRAAYHLFVHSGMEYMGEDAQGTTPGTVANPASRLQDDGHFQATTTSGPCHAYDAPTATPLCRFAKRYLPLLGYIICAYPRQ